MGKKDAKSQITLLNERKKEKGKVCVAKANPLVEKTSINKQDS